jgi:hypothetical protein
MKVSVDFRAQNASSTARFIPEKYQYEYIGGHHGTI